MNIRIKRIYVIIISAIIFFISAYILFKYAPMFESDYWKIFLVVFTGILLFIPIINILELGIIDNDYLNIKLKSKKEKEYSKQEDAYQKLEDIDFKYVEQFVRMKKLKKLK